MASVGSGASGKVLIGAGTGQGPTYVSIGVNSGLTAHGVLIAEGNGAFVATSAGTAGQVLTSNGAAADPTFQPAASPITVTNHALLVGGAANTINSLLLTSGQIAIGSTGADPVAASITAGTGISVTNGAGSITIASTVTPPTVTNHAVLLGGAGNTITSLPLTSGQLVIGSTGVDPVAATLTAGTGISITPGAGSITIASTSTGMAWTEVTGTTQAAAVGNGYILNNAALVTVTLPSTAALGSIIHCVGKGAGLWRMTANTGQTINFGDQTTTSAGTITATHRYDALQVVCTVANTTWTCTGVAQGNLTVA